LIRALGEECSVLGRSEPLDVANRDPRHIEWEGLEERTQFDPGAAEVTSEWNGRTSHKDRTLGVGLSDCRDEINSPRRRRSTR
jgi:hypothetical protein